MSDTWQNTLFYWSGEIEHAEESGAVEWKGKIVPLTGCQDARRGATPSGFAFHSSALNFSVKSEEIEKSNEKVFERKGCFELFFSSSGSSDEDQCEGFDIAGEALPWSDGKKRKQPASLKVQDEKRHLLFSRKMARSSMLMGARLIFGIGKNQYGNFLEVGVCTGGEYFSKVRVTLARRYLASPEDSRHQWSVQDLQAHVLFDLPPLISDPQAWSNILEFLPDKKEEELKHPWRTLALHGASWQEKVLREASVGALVKVSEKFMSPDLSGPPSPLLMPPLSGSFRLRLTGNFQPWPPLEWEDQCWGCGGPGVQETFSSELIEWTREEPNDSYSVGQYCSAECVRKAIPAIARCSSAWVANPSGYLLSENSSDEAFWKSLGRAEEDMLRSAGWQSDMGWGAGDWILKPDSFDEGDHSDY